MIPSDIRLYTWVDVEQVLLRKQEQNNWPEWLVRATAYWDELTIGIRPGTQAQASAWLEEAYEPRYRNHSQPEIVQGLIILESLPESERTLPIFFEETEEQPPIPRLTPSLSLPGVLWQRCQDIQPPDILSSDVPPVVAFHSFKGGVGRTTHALALAQALTEDKHKVLLVDGDLEAPGISWVFERRLPNPSVSFADLIALVHGDPSPDAVDAVKLVADRIQNALIDGIYVLPSFRSTEKFTTLEIRPEHLFQGAKNPFILTNILASLGQALGADFVIVDLRAGLSELSTGLILDPRVYRIFVTTLSAQSISGTVRLLELLGERALSRKDTEPLPALIINQIPDQERSSDIVLEAETKLLEAASPFLGEGRAPVRVLTSFTDGLLVLPPTWEEVVTRLLRSGIVAAVRPLVEWLPVPSKLTEDPLSNLNSKREELSKIAKKLVFAENAEVNDFLATTPLRHLASDNRRRLPIAVIVGAKGSGKTYTFLQIVSRKKWQNFAIDAGAIEVQSNAVICPIIESSNLQESARNIVREVRINAAKELGFEPSADPSFIRDHIRKGYPLNLHEGEWRDRWLNVIAWGVGFDHKKTKSEQEETTIENTGRRLTEYLVANKKQLVVVIDGLEDLFQNFASDRSQQTAIRSLLQDVPEWLGQQPSLPLGIIIFVRRDMVLAAVHQNAAQMMARYEPYALKWNREEALRLVAWVTKRVNMLRQINSEELQNMSEEELTEALVPLWGKRLGSERSREAGSARFAIAAISDLRGQIQARDLVRLLHLAAKESVNGDSRWQDRILIPTAIKGALSECSRNKIDEIEIENTALKDVFTKLRSLPQEKRKIPFTRDEMEISVEEMKILEDNCVVIRENDYYYMPEIFRLGLEFSLTAAGRPKVIALARRPGQGG
jgi:MinD-like ATPase involved in chromosome partitioning or flagellar assembly